ncbi:MAG TPA: sucrose phosphorylase [Acidimicrobiia bacterium]|jgi:sucrose phosphorylase
MDRNEKAGSVAPRPQLLTYPDSLGGDLKALSGLLRGPLAGLFRGVHILPPFPSSGDRGFSPITYDQIDPRFGTWEDLSGIAEEYDVLLDLMVNHISRQSPQFQDFLRHGRASRYADLFITLDKVWPQGDPPPEDVARIFLRKPDSPFSTVTIEETGGQEQVWTSFGPSGWAEQIDLDVTSQAGRSLITDWLRDFAIRGARIVRLDAIGYVIKKPGTSCFMVEPEIYEFLEWITSVADSVGLILLPEMHDRYPTHQTLSARGYWTYDFVLPGLVLHAFHTGNAERLAEHLTRSPERQFTTLDCHDGIPVRPDLDGILEPSEMLDLADRVLDHGGNINRILSPAHSSEVDVHQLNCTYYSALGVDDDLYLAARAIQLFARGVPQIYYVGLLAGENDNAAVDQTGEGRAINRHDYSIEEVDDAAQRPVVRSLIDLIRLRNAHPAFDGKLRVETEAGSRLRLGWESGPSSCLLEVGLTSGQRVVETRGPGPDRA